MGEDQRREKDRCACLRRERQPDEYTCGKRIGLLARVSDSDHEEYGRCAEQRQEGVNGEEVAELDFDYRQGREQGCEQPDTAAEPGPAEEEYQADERRIGQPRHDASGESKIKDVPLGKRRGHNVDPLQHVKGKAAVAEPVRIQRALVGVQEIGQIAGRRHIEFADFGENGPFVGMKETAAVPVDPVEPQSQGQRQDDEQHRPDDAGALMPRPLCRGRVICR